MSGKNSKSDMRTWKYEEPTKEQILKELKEAIQELKLVEQGKLTARPLQELLK